RNARLRSAPLSIAGGRGRNLPDPKRLTVRELSRAMPGRGDTGAACLKVSCERSAKLSNRWAREMARRRGWRSAADEASDRRCPYWPHKAASGGSTLAPLGEGRTLGSTVIEGCDRE